MALLIVALIVSFIPSLLMFRFLLSNHPDDEHYRKNCKDLLFKGFGIVLLVMLLDLIISIVWGLLLPEDASVLIRDIFKCFVINAAVEEFSKFYVANKFIKQEHATVSKLDIIAYLTIAAISFGLLEDIVYMFGTNVGQIIVRGILMGHVPYELFMGYFYGKALAENNNTYKLIAFAVPVLLHGSYNLGLKEEMPDWSAIVVVTLVLVEFIYLIYMIFFIRKKRNDPEYTKPIFTE